MYVYPNVSFPSSPLCSPTTVSLTCTPSHSLAPTLLRLTRPYTYPCRPPSRRPSPFPPSFCARPAHTNVEHRHNCTTRRPHHNPPRARPCRPRRNVAPRAHAHEAGAARAIVRASTPRTPDSWEVQVGGGGVCCCSAAAARKEEATEGCRVVGRSRGPSIPYLSYISARQNIRTLVDLASREVSGPLERACTAHKFTNHTR